MGKLFQLLSSIKVFVRFETDTTVPSIAKSCNCPQPCQQTTYDVKVSTALYPSEEAAAFLDGRFGRFGFSKQYVK